MLLVLAWGALAIAVLASAAATWLLFFHGPRAEAVATGPAHVFKAGPLVVNIAGTDGRRYLRATIELGTGSARDLRRLEEQRAPILDATIGVLGATPMPALLDQAQRDALKTQLRERLNAVLGGPLVAQVFFTEFVVQ